MVHFMLLILARTPVWVWGIFLTLLVLGILQSKAREVSGVRLLALPLAMMVLSLYGTEATFSAQPAVLLTWGAAKLLAVVAGRSLRRPPGASYSRSIDRFIVPGSWAPLALMMTIFCIRYVTAVSLALDVTLSQSLAFACTIAGTYGLLSGTLLARAFHIFGSKKQL